MMRSHLGGVIVVREYRYHQGGVQVIKSVP